MKIKTSGITIDAPKEKYSITIKDRDGNFRKFVAWGYVRAVGFLAKVPAKKQAKITASV